MSTTHQMDTQTVIYTVKEIGWAYPYSPDAERFGFAKTGCWTVSTGKPLGPLKAKAGFSTHELANLFALTLPYPFGKYSVEKPPKTGVDL